MRGNQLSSGTDAAVYPMIMSVPSDFVARESRQVFTLRCAETAPGTRTSPAASGKHYPGDRSCRSILQDSACSSSKDKAVLAPPVFVFNKPATANKRRAEDRGDALGAGASTSKRVRSFTFPSPKPRCETGSWDHGRRVRSSSICFPPPRPVSRSNVFMPSKLCNPTDIISADAACPKGRKRGLLLRPAVLQAPQPWGCPPPPQLAEVPDSLTRPHSHPSCALLPAQVVQEPTEDRTVTDTDPPRATSVPPWLQAPRSRAKADAATANGVPFVFGENMSERVLSPLKGSEESSDSDSSSSDSESSDPESTCQMAGRRTLWESAAAYTAACGRRCLLKRVRVVTGEEQESNVVQLTCRLFVLEKGTQSWSERGRGLLRLNDLSTGPGAGLQSRIVMRHQGSLKVILNTRLWPHTHLRRPAHRNLQLTATDLESSGLRVFLIQAGAKDVARLYVAIHHRLVALRCATTGAPGAGEGGHDEAQRKAEEDEEGAAMTRLRPGGCDWKCNRPQICS